MTYEPVAKSSAPKLANTPAPLTAAAIAILARGRRLLRGAAVPPSARSALLEAATWRPGPSEPFAVPSDPGLAAAPRREDDAKSRDPQGLPDR